ncbi:MAG: S8/S53 family peptidase [Pseudonocardiales bacterium]|nr:S8/S53 family peptidase [Pseudonocardiales bacterium]MBV9031676.1 S8/S53 family peptidase [Pseudonocardiales bacterium]MBW0009358.1 S8/S53 family peptidase [Pseudonocardiales bacterium]
MPGARAVGAADPAETMSVTVVVRRRAGEADLQADRLPGERSYVRREEFAAAHGAHPDDVAAVASFARSHDLTVLESHPARRSVVLSGTVSAFSAAFGVELTRYEHADGAYRGRSGSVHVPAELEPVIEGVFGLDDRPAARPHFRHSTATAATQTTFTPPQVAQLYDFPTQGTGQGQTIAIIELGGGYRTSDLKTYFEEFAIPLPQVAAVSVDGGQNKPTVPNSADVEVMLDIEVAGAVAPGAHIVVYFAPNTDQGFLDAITTAVHDIANKPSVISISWGSAEPNWTPQALTSFDQAFADAARLGVTVCAASGDHGSADSVTDGAPHVDFPASSPHVLGCGGTTLQANGGKITSEVVWNEGGGSTGGGVSAVFPLPDWQSAAGISGTGRGVPDVAGAADPATGYLVRVDGQEFSIGGTSAVAPLWAGLIALINQRLGTSSGFLNPLLYSQPEEGTFHDITEGNNDVSGLGLYSAAPGWDPCTGWGSPDGAQLLVALTGKGK